MCGFAGVLQRPSSEEDWRALLGDMGRAILHRGPDDHGVWCDMEAGVGLAHRRLSIIDLSPEGHQPMASHGGRYQIVFNGEIYNYRELRSSLESLGETFHGHSDTEVMLSAIERWGVEAAVPRLRGMFAFALWDRQDRRLYLVRDRLGEKPLYFGWSGDAFLFGSELRALGAHPSWRGRVDRGAVALFMKYSCIPAPYTIYEGIHKLVPGTMLLLDWGNLVAGTPPRFMTYWSARSVAEAGASATVRWTDADAIKALDAQIEMAVGEQMMSDVPLGAFLSGGVDSTTVVAAMQRQSSRPVKTFTIGYHEGEYDESNDARAIARHLGTEHTDLHVSPREALAIVPRLSKIYDEPFADASQIPTVLVAQLAKQHVTVALSGDGGDELFAGYNRYLWSERVWNRISRMPTAARGVLRQTLQGASSASWDRAYMAMRPILPASLRQRTPGEKLHKLATVLESSTQAELYQRLLTHWGESPVNAPMPGTLDATPERWPAFGSFVQQMMFLDLVGYLPNDILVKVDRAAMSTSLESRVPFLDHRLVELAWRLPMNMKLRDGQSKWILRQAIYQYVPPALVERPKSGFSVPLDAWLRGPLREWAEGLLAPDKLGRDGLLTPDPIFVMWKEHLSGRRNWHHQLWDVLMLQAWLEEQHLV